MDTWYSVYPAWDTIQKDFLSVDDFYQKSADPPTDGLPDFGFTFAVTRSPKLLLHSRTVYTILQFLGDLGGLDQSLVMLLSPFVSLFSSSLFVRRVLNSSFKFDDAKPVWEPSQ